MNKSENQLEIMAVEVDFGSELNKASFRNVIIKETNCEKIWFQDNHWFESISILKI